MAVEIETLTWDCNLTLERPPIFFQTGNPLSEGVPRTLIVLGAARGGTTMVAQMLYDIGIFMGDRLGSTYQDYYFSQISRSLFHKKISIEDPRILDFIRKRNQKYRTWGWKFPSHVFGALYEKVRNPHIIAVFRDPVAIATRESVSEMVNTSRSFLRSMEQMSNISQYLLSCSYPCMFISYERALEQKAELVDALVAFSGESVPPQARLAAIDRAQPGSAAYIRETRARNVEGVIDRVDVEIAGWLRYPRQPNRRVSFAIYVDGREVYRGIANTFRKDLKEAFGTDGCHSFVVALDEHLLDGMEHMIELKIDGEADVRVLQNSVEWVLFRR